MNFYLVSVFACISLITTYLLLIIIKFIQTKGTDKKLFRDQIQVLYIVFLRFENIIYILTGLELRFPSHSIFELLY